MRWDEVPAIDHNGIITQYEVVYEPLETFNGMIGSDSINISNTMVTLSKLQEYVAYNVFIRAYTSTGPGPFSVDVVNRTLEDGKTLWIEQFVTKFT